MENALIIGGVLNGILGIFHLMFWKIFNWKDTLKPLNGLQKAIMQVSNIHLLLFMFIVGYLSIFQVEEMIATVIGQSLMLFVAAFYLIRALNQFIFFDMRRRFSWVIVIYCLSITGLYGGSWLLAV